MAAGWRLAAGIMSEVSPEVVQVRAVPIELSRLLKFAGWFESGGEAKHAIQAGRVSVNGEVERTVRRQIQAGAVVSWDGRKLRVAVA